MKFFQNWEQFESWLNQKGLFHMDFGLARMHRALAKSRLPRFPIIQVLGTNGKGSTSAFLASLAQCSGLRCGLYTSPHFLSCRERIQINGQILAKEIWLAAANQIYNDIEALDITYFEMLTLIAAAIFAQEKVDLAIFEAGLGGEGDATSALNADCQCFTPIAMDHAAIIGPKITHIARNKCNAIKPCVNVYSAPQYPAAASVLERICHERHARLLYSKDLKEDYLSDAALGGKNQQINAGLAKTAWRSFAPDSAAANDAGIFKTAIRQAWLPGRRQIIASEAGHPKILLDGAHNPHAINALMRDLPFQPEVVIFSALDDKNWRASLRLLTANLPDCLFLIPGLGNQRAADAGCMAAYAAKTAKAIAFCGENALIEALACASGPTLICGSLYLCAAFFAIFPHYLTRQEV